MQYTVQIWFKSPAKDRGTTLFIILYILILLIARSTWIQTLAIDFVVSTSSSSNWPANFGNPMIFLLLFLGKAMKSQILVLL